MSAPEVGPIKTRPRKVSILVAPLWAPLGMAIYVGVGTIPTPGSWLPEAVATTMVFSYGAMLIVGLPVYRLMVRLRWTSLLSAAAVGLLIGFLATYVGLFLLNLLRGPSFVNLTAFDMGLDWPVVGVFSALGALTSATFWFLERPDRHALDAG